MKGRLGVANAVLGLLIAGGGAYLWCSRPPSSHQSGAVPAKPNPQVPSPPKPIPGSGLDGALVARLDTEALQRWCQSVGIPGLPSLPALEPGVADALTQALHVAAQVRTPESFAKVGQICEAQLAHGSALTYFALALRQDPKDFRWTYYMGCVHQVTGRSQEALAAFENVVRMKGDYAITFARLGQLYLDAQRFEDAERVFRRFNELNPNDWLGHVGLARIALSRGDAAAALNLLKKAESMESRDFQVQYYLGTAYAHLGQSELAEKHFAQSAGLPRGMWFAARDPLDQELRRAAPSSESLFKEFERKQHSGDWPSLAALAEEIIQRRPDDATMMVNLASIYRKLKRFTEAHALLGRAEKIQAQNMRLLVTRAELLLAEGKPEAALKSAEEAIRLDPDFAGAYSIQGRALFLLQRLPAAEDSMRKALALRPGDASDMFVLCESSRLQEKKADAIACYQQVLERQPDFAAAKQRLAELGGSSDR